METVKAVYQHAWPYQQNKMNLPVANVEMAIPFYENVMGFKVTSRQAIPHVFAVLARDAVEIAINENGGDPTQDGCFFQVDDIESALAELKSKGLKKETSEINTESHGGASWKVFYVIAPDGLCFCIGQSI